METGDWGISHRMKWFSQSMWTWDWLPEYELKDRVLEILEKKKEDGYGSSCLYWIPAFRRQKQEALSDFKIILVNIVSGQPELP